ncbi:MAG: biotin/lipoyl-containing protein, partial [Byssovorax cruenta]
MATKVLVPLLGEGVEEVTVTKWLKKEGDSVNELEPLLEVNTDKVDTEIPAPASGTVLKILAEEGVPAKVGAVLAFIGKPGEAVDGGQSPVVSKTASAKPETAVEGEAPSPQPATLNVQPAMKQDLGFISPVVAKIAGEHGVNLQQVHGTGLNGRITK